MYIVNIVLREEIVDFIEMNNEFHRMKLDKFGEGEIGKEEYQRIRESDAWGKSRH